jgi:hypothetical protein
MNFQAPTSKLFFQPWYDIDLPQRVADVPALLNRFEKRLLYYIAKECYLGKGAIIDAGCFAGGSTVSLAVGLADNERKIDKAQKIVTYDRFVLDDSMRRSERINKELRGATSDDEFYGQFRHNTAGLEHLFRLEKGDLLDKRWDGEPVEILFLDIAKNWDLMRWSMEHHFSALYPGAILIHQDFADSRHYWLPFVMAYLRDYFDVVEYMEPCTVIYICRAAIPNDVIKVDLLKTLSLAEALALHNSLKPNLSALRQAMLDIQACYLCRWYGDSEMALTLLREAKARYAGLPRFVGDIKAAERSFGLVEAV